MSHPPDDPTPPRNPSSLARVAAFIASVGEGNVFKKLTLQEAVPGVSQADRRMRDLRELGWSIDNYKVNGSLKPDELLVRKIGVRVDLGEARPSTGRKSISGPKRRRILERDGFACVICGTPAGAEYDDWPGHTARLTIGHIIPVARNGSGDDDNLRAECQRCNEQSRDVSIDPPSVDEVLTHVRNLGGRESKRKLYAWMQAGKRSLSDEERVFNTWLRLPVAQRQHVIDELSRQI